ADHQDLHYELDHVIDAVYGGGCRMMLIFRSRPATPAGRALQPLSHRSWKLHCGTSWSRTYPISRLRSADMVHTEASRELARGISDRHRGKKKASWWGAFLDDRQGRPTPTDAYFTPTK